MAKLSVLIPSRNERYLGKTVHEVLSKATGEIEVVVVLDGYWPDPPLPDDPRLIIIHRGQAQGMRAGVNAAVAASHGTLLMKLDAHCMLDEGFDEKLAPICEPDCVVIPRRYRIDGTTWMIKPNTPERPPEDYEHFMFPRKHNPVSLHGFRWVQRCLERSEIPLDETLTFQGSCWLMTREHFDLHGFMQIEGYHGLPQQEAEEIGLSTWYGGGRVLVFKDTWYAHMHKETRDDLGYSTSLARARECYAYSYNRWVLERRKDFTRLIEKFWPLPGWPEDWERRLFP